MNKQFPGDSQAQRQHHAAEYISHRCNFLHKYRYDTNGPAQDL